MGRTWSASHTRRKSRGYAARAGWIVVGSAGLAAVAMGISGFLELQAELGTGSIGAPAVLEALYNTLHLFVFSWNLDYAAAEIPPRLEIARYLAPLFGFYAIFRAARILFRRQFDRWLVRFNKHHVVICGVGEKGMRLARAFREEGAAVVVIDRDPLNPRIGSGRDIGCAVVVGDCTHAEVLQRARVDRARYLIAVMEDDDSNAEMAAMALELCDGRPPGSLICAVHLDDLALWRMFREEEFLGRDERQPVRLEFFNVCESAARAMLDRHPPVAVTSDAERLVQPHIVVVGLGRLGWSLVVRAAKDWRLGRAADDPLPLVSIVDTQATTGTERLLEVHPALAETVTLQPRNCDLRSGELAGLRITREAPVTAAYVCDGDGPAALAAALALERWMFDSGASFPIVVRVEESKGLASLLSRTSRAAKASGLIHSFALLDATCTVDLLTGGVTEALAQAIHASYVRDQQRKGDSPRDNRSMVAWDELPERLRDQNRDQADSIAQQLASAGYRIVPLTDWDSWRLELDAAQVESLAQVEHARWAERMEADGWRYGRGPKDSSRRTHPDLKPWAELSEVARDKDRDAVRTWPSLLFLAGFEARRVD